MRADTINVKISKVTKNKLRQYAKAKNVPMALVVRVALNLFMREDKP
jgi:hypothetical protein